MDKMTDQEALDMLNAPADEVYWFASANDKPAWYGEAGKETIALDGDFTREQLLAILHFHPSNKG
jgi:hypothetical protein